jgi:hypothetical protein
MRNFVFLNIIGNLILNIKNANGTIAASNGDLALRRREVECEHTSRETRDGTHDLVVVGVIEHFGFVRVAATGCDVAILAVLQETT